MVLDQQGRSFLVDEFTSIDHLEDGEAMITTDYHLVDGTRLHETQGGLRFYDNRGGRYVRKQGA